MSIKAKEKLHKIREETLSDHQAISEVNNLAFGRNKESVLVENLRAGGTVVISLVAEDNGKLVGHIMLSRGFVEKEDKTRRSFLMLGPVAVLPNFQKQGIGSALIKEAIKIATLNDESGIILLGHKDYYPKFGFSTSTVLGIQSSFNKESFMGLELKLGTLKDLSGKIKYPKAFGLDPEWTA